MCTPNDQWNEKINSNAQIKQSLPFKKEKLDKVESLFLKKVFDNKSATDISNNEYSADVEENIFEAAKFIEIEYNNDRCFYWNVPL